MATDHFHAFATVTSKGQITIPKPLRDALGVDAGDRLLFKLEGDEIVVTKNADLLELAGSVPVPAGVRGKSFDEVRRTARTARANP